MSLAASAVMVFILGTILGSFLNVVIYRLPRGLSIVRPGSRCPHCHTLIRPRDNIPLMSFLILRGRCRACRAPISWRYPLVEAASGGLLAGLWLRFAMMGAFLGWPLTAVALLLAFVTGAVAGVLLIALKRRSRKDPIPFGPSLAAGGVIAMFAGQSLLRWYFGIP